MASTNERSSALRLTFLSVVLIGLFVALFSRLWFLQVLAGDRYAELAEGNRLRTVVTEAPRGDILAADGEPLVENRPALTVSAERQVLLDGQGEPRDEEAEATLDRLGDVLQLDRDELIERMTDQAYSPLRATPILSDVTPEVAFSIQEHQELFPGVITETLPIRTYPQERLAAHLVGYVGEITPYELDQERFADYSGGDVIGQDGLEATYETELRGEKGRRIFEVDAQGTVLEVLRTDEPTQGDDLRTSIDLDLQRATERLLEEGIIASRDVQRDDGRFLPSVAGSAVVLDADDASVLAMASYPTFDPREFVGGVSTEYYDAVISEANEKPAENKAIEQAYPPGSVFKIITGAAMLQADQITPQSLVGCPSSLEFGGEPKNNWNPVDEGPMNLSTALKRSCDTYFYELAFQQWQQEERDLARDGETVEVLAAVAERFGLGSPLGIDLPLEASGFVPDRESVRQTWEEDRDYHCGLAEALEEGSFDQLLSEENCSEAGANFTGGDAANNSIGQGLLATTPLQMAASYVAIANGGTLMQPTVGEAILDQDGEVLREIEPERLGELELAPGGLDAIQSGLERVVMEERGTGRDAFTDANAEGQPFPLEQIPVAGKTGTAEQGTQVPFAWFASYAPADDPEIVVVVQVEEGGGGSQTAAPIARNILDHHFDLVDAEDAEFEAGAENE